MDITEIETFSMADAVNFNKTLNPRLWNDDESMRPEVRKHLLAMANDFAEFLGVDDLDLQDITVSGSNAGYTYTPHSDIDLHLIVKMPTDKSADVYRELFNAKKYQYNNKHNLHIGRYDVEFYVQDAAELHHSAGVFSVMNDDWISIPKRVRATVDDMSTKAKVEDIAGRIDDAVESKDRQVIEKLTAHITDMRKAGLNSAGEMSPENLAFKILRAKGEIQRLYDAQTSAYDAELSLESKKKGKKKKAKVNYGYGVYGTGFYGSNEGPGSDGTADAGVSESKLLDKPTLSVAELAEKHGVPVEDIKSQLKMGIEVELEHTSDRAVAKEIALDHIGESPTYYTRLKTIEEELHKVNGKWALTAKDNPKKVLQYYDGDGKPSEEWVDKVEKRVNYFKHVNEEGVGKITKQNTTADVKPGETKRQAAKFGNKVSKDGIPSVGMRADGKLTEAKVTPERLERWAASHGDDINFGFELEAVLPGYVKEQFVHDLDRDTLTPEAMKLDDDIELQEILWPELYNVFIDDVMEKNPANTPEWVDVNNLIIRNNRAAFKHLREVVYDWAHSMKGKLVDEFLVHREKEFDLDLEMANYFLEMDFKPGHILEIRSDPHRYAETANKVRKDYESRTQAEIEFEGNLWLDFVEDHEMGEILDLVDDIDESEEYHRDGDEDNAANILALWATAHDKEYTSDLADAFASHEDPWKFIWPYYYTDADALADDDEGIFVTVGEQFAEEMRGVVGSDVIVSGEYHGNQDFTKWRIEPDTTIAVQDDTEDFAFELISPIMSLNDGTTMVLDVFRKLQNMAAVSNRSTGFHINLSTGNFEHVDRVKYMLFSPDKHVLEMFHRQSNQFCHRLRDTYRDQVEDMSETETDIFIDLIRKGLETIASKLLSAPVTKAEAKYRSQVWHDDYLEIRAVGSEDFLDEPYKIVDITRHYAYLLNHAADKNANRTEYLRRLYKLISPLDEFNLSLSDLEMKRGATGHFSDAEEKRLKKADKQDKERKSKSAPLDMDDMRAFWDDSTVHVPSLKHLVTIISHHFEGKTDVKKQEVIDYLEGVIEKEPDLSPEEYVFLRDAINEVIKQ